MSVFFEYPTDVTAAGKGSILATSFSDCVHPILAVATSNGDLTLFHEEGETISIEVHTVNGHINSSDNSALPASFHRSSECDKLRWQPHRTILACGWKDGCVSIWSEKDRAFKEQLGAHSSAVTLVDWNASGTRLFTGDANGVLCIWHVDARHRLNLVSRIEARGAITNLAFQASASAQASEECPPFFVGTASGCVIFADDSGRSSCLVQNGAAIVFMHYSTSGDFLSVVDRSANLFKYSMSESGGMECERTSKLSVKGDGSDLCIELCGASLIGGSNRENLVRFWSLDRDESYVLCFDGKHMASAKDVITCISFNPRKRVLCGGTVAGRIVFWRFVGSNNGEIGEHDWEGLPAMESSESIEHISWGPGEGLLALHNSQNVSIVLETVMHFRYVKGASAVQLTADSMQILRSNDSKPIKFTAGIRVKGLDIAGDHVLVWNGKRAELRSTESGTAAELISSFQCRASHCCLHADEIYCAIGSRVEICNFQGTVVRLLPMAEHEGAPVAMHCFNHFLAVATDKSRLAVFDLSKPGDCRVLVPFFSVAEMMGENRVLVTSVRINASGSRVSLLCRLVDAAGIEVNDTRIHVYDVETDRLQNFDFGPKRYPALHEFDEQDTRLLVVECKEVEARSALLTDFEADATIVNHETADVTTLFCTGLEHGLAMQDSFSIDPTKDTLMAIEVPYFLFLSRPDDESQVEWQPKIKQRTMRDFVGLESVNADTQRDLLSFSFAVTIGNMDEAYRCVKKIGGGGEAIWENLAQQCVKTKRLDVAEICLANLNNARGVRALRIAKQAPEPEVAIAEVAIQLHLLDDAERLYRECKRFDKLSAFYAASGRWKDAIATASRHDRINLRTLHHSYGRHLEQQGEITQAIEQFELAGTAKVEVPRMMYDAGLMNELHDYVDHHAHDVVLLKWWAQHCESSGDLDGACQYYNRAGENLALVRIHCFRSDMQLAYDLCLQTKDPAACFHLARQLESMCEIDRAIEFYSHAECHNHAIRLAIENDLDAPLLTAALQTSDSESKLLAAEYFEQRGSLEKAAMLYERGGRLHKAIELCFQASLFDALRTITERIEQSSDQALLIKCATFFLNNQQFEKAASLLLSANDYKQAVEIYDTHSLPVTEALAERMTPPKPASTASPQEKKERETVLLKLASICRAQGAYHLACKKFTQAGDSMQAIQCLIKSGDTEKIVYYATMAKKPEVWILAANHLSALDWRADPTILSHIVSFYSKAKAWTQLTSFFDTCSRVEIDEYRDYDRALVSLGEASKACIKAKIPDKERKLKELQDRITSVESFIQARNLIQTDPMGMIRACEEMCQHPEVPGGVRLGDIFALLVEYQASTNDFVAAMRSLDDMSAKGIAIGPYIDTEILIQVHEANGRPFQANGNDEAAKHDMQQDEDNDVPEQHFEEEEVEEDL